MQHYYNLLLNRVHVFTRTIFKPLTAVACLWGAQTRSQNLSRHGEAGRQVNAR